MSLRFGRDDEERAIGLCRMLRAGFRIRLDSELHAAHGSGYAGHCVDVVADDVANVVQAVGFNHTDDVVGTGYSVDLDCLIELFQGFEDGVAFAGLGFD